MKYRLDQLFELQMGKTPSRANLSYWSGTNKWVSIADLSSYDKFVEDTKECITDIAVKESGIKVVPKDTVIMSFKLSLGKTAITTEPTYTNEAIMAFVDKGICEINSYYLYFLFSGMDWSKGTNKAVLGLTLNKATLSKYSIDIPNINTQVEIVKRLDLLTSIIIFQKRALEKLDELIKSRFVEMFGDCKSNPKKWNVFSLEDISEVGSSKRVFVDELQENGIPFYRGTEVGALAEGQVITPELFITEEHYLRLIKESGLPKQGDLLMPSICPDGRIWLVDSDKPFYFKDGRVLWIHNINTKINSTFLLYTLKDRIMTDYLSIASGTTFAELKIFSLKKCKVFDVPYDLQIQFERFINSVNQQKATVQKSIEKLETLKKSLMQEYFG